MTKSKRNKVAYEQRILEEAKYIINTGSSLREAAKVTTKDGTKSRFGVTYFTIHRDMTIKLRELDLNLYNQVREVFRKNKSRKNMNVA